MVPAEVLAISRTNAGSWNRMSPAGLPLVIVRVTEPPVPVMVKLIRCPSVVGKLATLIGWPPASQPGARAGP